MNGSLLFWLSIATAVVILWPEVTGNEACWEKCYQAVYATETGRYRDIYDDILDMALEIKAIINTHNITKVGFALDSSVSQRRNPVYNPRIYTSGMQNQTVEYIFYMNFIISHILTFTLDRVPYLVQYDQDSAWGCEGFQCEHMCRFTRGIRWQSPAEVRANSHCPDNVEAACSLLGNYMTMLPCSYDNSNTRGIIIVIANSDFYSSETHFKVEDPLCKPFHKPKGLESPCAQFEHRYVIAVHNGNNREMKKFASKPENFWRLPQNMFTYNAAKNLYLCLNPPSNRPCCPPTTQVNFTGFAPVQCDRTAGAYGEVISNFPNHFALAIPNRFIPLPP